jgi:hypothetical protein
MQFFGNVEAHGNVQAVNSGVECFNKAVSSYRMLGLFIVLRLLLSTSPQTHADDSAPPQPADKPAKIQAPQVLPPNPKLLTSNPPLHQDEQSAKPKHLA